MPGIGGKLNDTYLEEMPLKTKLVNGAKKVLDYEDARFVIAGIGDMLPKLIDTFWWFCCQRLLNSF